MHALGFDHEQKRGDQAQNVYIHYGWFHFLRNFHAKVLIQNYILGNISPGLHYAFEVMPANEWMPLGYGYDITSGAFFNIRFRYFHDI